MKLKQLRFSIILDPSYHFYEEPAPGISSVTIYDANGIVIDLVSVDQYEDFFTIGIE